MKTNVKAAVFIGVLLISVASLSASGQISPPRLFFTDILTGANKGGENNNGVYLTIYGKGFGASQGSSTVTIGGGTPAQYKIWGQNNSKNTMLDMIVVQIGGNAATGNVVVTVNGVASNPLPFTVATGNIYFVSPNGSDSKAGTFASPWLTPLKARSAVSAGDTVYFRAGTYTTQDAYNSVMVCNGACNGTPSAYVNFLGYPGETAQLGDGTAQRAIYHWKDTVWNYATIAELTLRSHGDSFACGNITSGAACNFIRLVGNDTRSLNSGGNGIDLEMPIDHFSILGNESAQNCAADGACTFDTRAYALYLGGYGAQTNTEVGWNRFHDNPFGKGIQLYGHLVGDTEVNLTIHDNLIYNNAMPAMTLGGGDPSSSGGDIHIINLVAYNNVLWNDNYSGRANGQGPVQVQSYNHPTWNDYHFYNNTIYNDGLNVGANSPPATIIEVDDPIGSFDLQDNILVASPTATTFIQNLVNFTGGHNLYFGLPLSNIPSFDTTSIYGDPQFVGASTDNLQLQAGSPAIDAGVPTSVAFDYLGVPRPQGSAFDIGAYEFFSGSPTPPTRPAPPTNLRVVVE